MAIPIWNSKFIIFDLHKRADLKTIKPHGSAH